MKKFTGLMSVCLLMLVFAVSADASMYLYANAANTIGGLRFDVAEGTVVDVAASLASNSGGTSSVIYADVFKGYWGLGVQATIPAAGDTVYDLSLLFAVEQPVNDKITLGIGVPVVNVNTSSPTTTTMMSAFSLYGILKI
jgi:hypothetical protein